MRAEEKARLEANKLDKRLCRLVGQAIADFDMIGAGERVMVCLSGGKDRDRKSTRLTPVTATSRMPSSA